MKKINRLTQKQIEQIAAGEVIVRPSAVIKELVENSIDSGATEIIIETKDSGLNWLRITDNGSGISKDDFSLLFERHATSKLPKADNILDINTLGFRGEALASIHAISDIELITRTSDDDYGSILKIDAYEKNPNVTSCGAPVGTSVCVKNLFKTMPVRKKYIQSERSEVANNTKWIKMLSLSHPEIKFVFKHQNKIIFKTPGKNNILKTIFEIFDSSYTSQLIPINYNNSNIEIAGYISNIHYLKGSRKYQYLFINNRSIQNFNLTKDIESSYRELSLSKTFPVFFIYMKIPNEFLDVNVHPQKAEVYIEQSLEINKIMKTTVLEALSKTRKTNQIINEVENEVSLANDDFIKADFNKINDTLADKVEIQDFNKKNDLLINAIEFNSDEIVSIVYENNDEVEESQLKISEVVETDKTDFDIRNRNQINYLDFRIIGTFIKTYILLEDSINKKLFLLDQHAAHEKILYEKIINSLDKKNIETQYLLKPEIFALDSINYKNIISKINDFNNLGFDVEIFDETSIILRGIPILFTSENSRELFEWFLDTEIIDTTSDRFRYKYAKMACTKAVKSGDLLSNVEITKLLEDLSKCDKPNICPHGRPTIVEFTKFDIEKFFKRIQ